MSTDETPSKPVWSKKWIALSVLLVALAAGLLVGWGFGDGWGAPQWGPVAAWFSGLLTTVAVGVALYQTIMARRDADIARADAAEQVASARADAEAQRLHAVEERSLAEERHAQQLKNSEELLSREIDAQRRSEQVAALQPIWQAIGSFTMPFRKYVGFLEYDLIDLLGDPDRDAAAATFEEKTMPFMDELMALELSFMPAQMLVGEPHVFDAVNDLYEEVRELQMLCNTLLMGSFSATSPPDTSELEQVYQRIVLQRRVMTRVVREHLVQVPPLTRKFSWSDLD